MDRRVGLYFDDRDVATHRKLGSRLLNWLSDLGAKPIREAKPTDGGFLFAGARSIDDYRDLVRAYPGVHDRPEVRAPLLRLDLVLDSLTAAGIEIPTPRTWRMGLDDEPPVDLTYPLFLRTVHGSIKLGGRVSRVRNRAELESEAAELRRLLGWDSIVLARQWHRLAEAGHGMFGPIPQEIRVWIVDGSPIAWSFHYLGLLPNPRGFPPKASDLEALYAWAQKIGRAFQSRCVVADFAREINGDWLFIEAGPGSCAGTAHEHVFKAVASRLLGDSWRITSDSVGGDFGAIGG